MRDQVAGEGDEARIGNLRSLGAEAADEQRVRGVDSAGVAAALQRGEGLGLVGRVGLGENGGPLPDRCCGEAPRLCGIVKGIEVEIAEQQRGYGRLPDGRLPDGLLCGLPRRLCGEIACKQHRSQDHKQQRAFASPARSFCSYL